MPTRKNTGKGARRAPTTPVPAGLSAAYTWNDVGNPAASAGQGPARTKKVVDFLVQDGLLRPEQRPAVLQYVQQQGARPEEAVLELGFVSEGDLLKSLATHYRTRFLSTEKLAKAEFEKSTLDLVPRRFAEQATVFPVAFDTKGHVLTIVTADPDDDDLVQKVALGSGAREVRAIVARPAAIRAAIAKAYGGDIHAFSFLERQAQAQFHTAFLDRGLVEINGSGQGPAASPAASTTQAVAAPAPAPVPPERVETESRKVEAFTMKAAFTFDELLELLSVMVSLQEAARGDLRGHSAQVARLARQMTERLKIAAPLNLAIVAAAYVHDLGKMGQFHLTALNVSQYEGHGAAAQRAYATPTRLLEAVRLPPEAVKATYHMYERFDGSGFPDGLSGKEIPLGARVVAITDTYADLTQNTRNPFRKCLSAEEACQVLAKYKSTVFDPHLVDLFRHVVVGEDVRARLLANRYTALLVDVDPEETTVLELRLIEQGFVVRTAKNAEQAQEALIPGDVDLVVSELDLPDMDGLALLATARGQAWGKELPWVIYTRRQDRAEAQRAFELGVLDFVAKPAVVDVLVAKLKALLDQRATKAEAGGVTGSLKEMSLPDMVQVLSHARKTGALRIRSGGQAGEVHFLEGAIVNAAWGELRGEDAFFAMARMSEGEFGLDPTFRPKERAINQSSEALLLECMRRMDEGIG